MYYIEKKLVIGDEDYGWKMVTIENNKEEAVELLHKTQKENPKDRYRVVKYVDIGFVDKGGTPYI